MIIPFGKYKDRTVHEIVDEDIGYATWVAFNTNFSNQVIVEAFKEAIKTHQLTKLHAVKFSCNLTHRVSQLIQTFCLDDVRKQCNIPICRLDFEETKLKFPFKLIQVLKQMHRIHPSVFGVYIDYLIRRILAEEFGMVFSDDRFQGVIGDGNVVFIGAEDQPADQKKFWNEWFNTVSEHYDKCRDMSIPSKQVIESVFEISLAHNYYFFEYDIFTVVQQFRDALLINSLVLDQFIGRIRGSFKQYKNIKNVLLNPKLGSTDTFPADADLIFDDVLIDIKCSLATNNHVRNLYQLLGYSALHLVKNEKFINTIKIFNPIENVIQSWDISQWSRESRMLFVKLLTNGEFEIPLEIPLEYRLNTA